MQCALYNLALIMISSKLSLLVALFAIAAALIAAVPLDLAQSHVHDVTEAALLSEETESVDVSVAGNFNMFLTCDNEFDLFVNGQKVGTGNSWTSTYNFNADVKPGDVIAIDGRDAGGPAAFIGIFNGVPTNPNDWRCKDTTTPPANWNANSFDDSAWAKAVSYGRNDGDNVWKSVGGGARPSIPADAEWLWTSDNNNHDRVFCRYKPTQSVRSLTRAFTTMPLNYCNRPMTVPKLLWLLKTEITRLFLLP